MKARMNRAGFFLALICHYVGERPTTIDEMQGGPIMFSYEQAKRL